MSLYKQNEKTLQNEQAGKKSKDYDYKSIRRQRLIDFRKQKEAIVRIEKPTNLARARKLGYRAKEGFVIARVRVRKGSGLHKRPVKARRPKRMGVKKLTRKTSIKSMAEKKANKKYPNCEVLNSYYIGEDGINKYYEIILVDVSNPNIYNDRKINWICEPQHKGRGERGLTSSQKKSRGLRKKGKGAEKVRPSLRAKKRQAK